MVSPKRTNSKLGVVSFFVSLSAILMFIIDFILSTLSVDYEDYIIQIGLSMILGYICVPVGVGLGITSLVRRESKNIYVILGLIINLLFVLIFLISFIIAVIETPDIRQW